ncbi:MAG: c-type cytochrome [Methyloligellaceae bacterium]
MVLLLAFLSYDLQSSRAAMDVERGRQIAKTHCARCHSITLEGDSPHKEAPAFRILSSKYPLEHLQESLAEGISVGHHDMPEFVFNPDDIDHLIGFLNWLNNPKEG